MRHRSAPVIGVILMLIASACGTRLGHDEIVEAARGEPTAIETRTTSGEAKTTTDPVTTDTAVATASPTSAPSQTGSDEPPAEDAPAAVAQAGPATGPTIRIGNIGTYSGVLGSIFKQGQAAAQAFGNWINANGGLGGHRVEIISADDGGDPAKYLSLAKDMVENRGVIAFMGNLVPLSGAGAVDYLEERQIPVVGGDVIHPTWTTSPMLFPQATSIDAIINAMPVLGRKAGKSKYAIFYCAESTICTHGKELLADQGGVERAGGEVVYTAQVSLAQPDFTAECLQAKDRGAEAMIVGADGNTLSRAANSCAQQGFHPLWLTLSLAMIDSIASNPNLDGTAGPMGTFPWVTGDIEPAQWFRQAMARYAPGTELTSAASAVWTSGLLLREATRELPDDPTSADILEGLWSIGETTLGGAAPPLRFNRGAPAPPSTCYFQMSISGGSWSDPVGSEVSCD